MRRHLARLGFALAVLWVGWSVVRPVQDAVTTSFAGYWVVARALAAGVPIQSLYADEVLATQMQAQGIPLQERMIGPPSLALTLRPLAALPYTQARRVWLWGVCLPTLAASAWLLGLRLGPIAGPLLAGGLLLSAPVESSLRVGQVYPVLLLLHGGALWLIVRQREGLAGACAAPMMAARGWYGLPLALLWLGTGRWRAGLAALGLAAALVLASIPAVGADAWVYFFSTHLGELAQTPYAGTPAYQTLRSLFLHMTTTSPLWGPDPPIPWPALAAPLRGLCSLLLLTLTAWRLRVGATAAEGVALATTLELLLAPVAEEYHFVLAALPMAVALEQEDRWARRLALLALPLIFAPLDYQTPALLGGWRSLLAYPRVYGMVLLWLALIRPLTPRSRTAPAPPPSQTGSLWPRG